MAPPRTWRPLASICPEGLQQHRVALAGALSGRTPGPQLFDFLAGVVRPLEAPDAWVCGFGEDDVPVQAATAAPHLVLLPPAGQAGVDGRLAAKSLVDCQRSAAHECRNACVLVEGLQPLLDLLGATPRETRIPYSVTWWTRRDVSCCSMSSFLPGMTCEREVECGKHLYVRDIRYYCMQCSAFFEVCGGLYCLKGGNLKSKGQLFRDPLHRKTDASAICRSKVVCINGISKTSAPNPRASGLRKNASACRSRSKFHSLQNKARHLSM
jgi:hypothetical protein